MRLAALFLVATALGISGSFADASASSARATTSAPDRRQDPALRIECPASADTGICAHPREVAFQHGAKPTLRLKGNEHYVLLRFDLAHLPTQLHPRRARLHLRTRSAARPQWIGVSSVARVWEEGSGNGPDAPSGATYLHANTDSQTWDGPHSNFLDVSFGAGCSAWEPQFVRHEGEGWISIAIPPWLVRAMREGRSDGLALSDEKGQTRANYDFAARESGAAARLALWDFESEAPSLPETVREPLVPRVAQHSVPPQRALEWVPNWPEHPEFTVTCGTTIIRALPSLRAAASTIDSAPDIPQLDRVWDPQANASRIALYAFPGGAASFVLHLPAGAPALQIEAHGEWWPSVYEAIALRSATGTRRDPLQLLRAWPLELHACASERVLYIEWQLPFGMAPEGQHVDCALQVRAGEDEARIPVRLVISPMALPSKLRFQLSLNTYGPPAEDPALELAFHRLAHVHRSTLAVVPYSQGGRVSPAAAPRCFFVQDELHFDFEALRARYGSYFDGSAFEACPRSGVPPDHWIAPFHENWPSDIETHYQFQGTFERHASDAPPIAEAFTAAYAQNWRASLLAWYDEVVRRGWLDTRFQVFLNNKVDFRQRGRGTSWWLLDEPAYRDDFLALQWFADLHRAALPAEARQHMPFRVDLSRPQFRRSYLDGRVDLVINNAARWWPRASLDPVRDQGEALWSYGETPSIADPLHHCSAWVFEAFATGADGLVPWQSVGTRANWNEASALALLLPPNTEHGAPAPTLRLKALRDAVEDIEILLLQLDAIDSRVRHSAREEVAAALIKTLRLRPLVRWGPHDRARSAFEDADLSAFMALHKQLVLQPASFGAAFSRAQGK